MKLLHLITVVTAIFIVPSVVTAATNQQDVDALKALHQSWLSNPSLWDTSTDPCDDSWLGIRCNNSRVTQMILINQGLQGTLAPAIGNLTSLIDVDLSSNAKLGGSLPAEIGNLTQAQRFMVQFCNFSGPIPDSIGNMRQLQYFGLTQNKFTGPLPDTIGLLTELIWLDVQGNRLSGPLPVSATSTSGSGLDNLTRALHFHLQNNSFSGVIPSTIFNTNMSLIHLLLAINDFEGSIPSNINDLTHLEIICLEFNRLNNSIPASISTLENLTTLQVQNNSLSGLPDLSNNTNMQMLNVSANPFPTSTVPSWITKLEKLYELSMDANNLIGEVPAEFFNFSSSLTNVTLSSNSLNGTLNLTLANLTSLELVDLRNNNITKLVGNFSGELLLDGNPYCSENQDQCAARAASTSNDSLATAQCTNECTSEYAINPRTTAACECQRPVVATCGFYAMKVPVLTLGDVTEIQSIVAQGLADSNFLQLQSIIVAENQTLVEAVSTTTVLISVFPPSGKTLWTTDAANDISYILQNQDIQFPLFGPIACGFYGSIYGSVEASSFTTAMKIGIGVGVAILVIIIILLGIFAMKFRTRAIRAEKLNKPFAAWISDGLETANIPQLKGARYFSLAEILKCTNNFSPNNEIGQGGYGKVYKGLLLSGDTVAIKRANAKSLQGLDEFKIEIELLSRVHHRNLVGLIGFCFEEGEQILVYEFMPNGTLGENLSGRTGLIMDWNRRICLALDSARGIAYLHSEANPPIIHRDIKSGNILLSEKLVAKVADFGLCKLFDDGEYQETTQVKGTLGYLDPDYYMTNRLTEKSDVYSFGVVLLEILTGRPPIQGSSYIVREVRTALQKGGMELVAESIVDSRLTDYPYKGMERLMILALSCVQENPDKRPTMSVVVKELEVLVEVNFTTISLDIDMADAKNNLNIYEEDMDDIQQKNGGIGKSFEYSGNFIGMSRPILPK